MKYEIVMTESFWKELINIVYYISYNLGEPHIAERKFDKVINNVITLNSLPERCPRFTNDDTNIRKLIILLFIK